MSACLRCLEGSLWLQDISSPLPPPAGGPRGLFAFFIKPRREEAKFLLLKLAKADPLQTRQVMFWLQEQQGKRREGLREGGMEDPQPWVWMQKAPEETASCPPGAWSCH